MDKVLTTKCRAVIIGGLHRSGTSLTAVLIGNHSEVAMPDDEFNFFTKVLKYWHKDGRLDQATVEQIVEFTYNLPKVKYWQLPKELVFNNLRHIHNLGDIYLHFLKALSIHKGKSIISEKSPGNEFYYPILKEWFNAYDFKFVHLVRHPYDVVASINNYEKNAFGGKKMTLSQLIKWCRKWNKSVQLGRLRQQTQAGYLLLKYEDIIKSPTNVIEVLCKFLQIKPELDVILNSSYSRNNNFNNSSFKSITGDAKVGIVKKSARKWDRLNLVEKCIIKLFCSSNAQKLNYDLPLFISNG